MKRSSFVYAASILAVGTLGACTENNAASSGAGGLSVSSTNDACKVSATTAPSGNISFNVTNDGSKVTEFYLLAADGLRIVGEAENIGPGISRKLVLQASPGKYITACKPGMTGTGIRADFTVTESGKAVAAGGVDVLLKTATDQYLLYVREQTAQLLEATTAFAALYTAGKDDEARATYASSRMHWERIEPVAESFGDIDPLLDTREADLEPGQKWTGWHAIEKDLWPPADGSYVASTPEQRKELAVKIVADTTDLANRVSTVTVSATQLGNGAKELLDEIATGKVTGEEEIWSHTDLWDFQANVEGARIAFEVLKPVLAVKDQALASTLTERFADVQALLDKQRVGEGFTLYGDLTADEVKAFAAAVNGLAEPLSRLTAAVVL